MKECVILHTIMKFYFIFSHIFVFYNGVFLDRVAMTSFHHLTFQPIICCMLTFQNNGLNL